MGVKLTWTKVGTTHLTRRPLAGVARDTPGSTQRSLAAAFGALGESLGAHELHLPHQGQTDGRTGPTGLAPNCTRRSS